MRPYSDPLGVSPSSNQGGDKFTEGPPSSGLSAKWMESLREEIEGMIYDSQGNLNKNDSTQLKSTILDLSINKILSGGSNADFTNMPEVGGDKIIDSGSNSNGNYLKFYNGTMICSFAASNITISSHDSSSFSWTYPVQFDSDPDFVDARVVISFSNKILVGIEHISKSTIHGFVFNSTGSSFTSRAFNMFAIGKWK